MLPARPFNSRVVIADVVKSLRYYVEEYSPAADLEDLRK